MAISLQTISFFNGTGSMVLNANGTGLESAGVGHRLKSFFGIGDARAKNAATLNAIRMAINDAAQHESAFASTDIRAKTESLLAEIRTDRAIDASRIKGIVNELTSLTSRDDKTLDKRVDMHLAARGLPKDLSNCGEQVTFISRQVARRHNASIGATRRTDVGQVVDYVANRCSSAIKDLSDLPDGHSKEVEAFVGQHLEQFLLHNDGTLRSEQEVKDAGAFCCQASRGGHRLVREAGITDLEIEAAKPFDMAAAEFVVAVGRPVTSALFDKIDGYVRNMSLREFTAFKDGLIRHRTVPSGDNIRSAIGNVVQHMLSNPLKADDGSPLFRDDKKAFEALGRYVAKLVGLRLSLAMNLSAQLYLPDLNKIICDQYQCKPVNEVLEKMVRDAIIQQY